MSGGDERSSDRKACGRCGGTAVYWRTALIPGDPRAPRGSSRAVAHHQPAWTCTACGWIEPHERRSHPPDEHERLIWRV